MHSKIITVNRAFLLGLDNCVSVFEQHTTNKRGKTSSGDLKPVTIPSSLHQKRRVGGIPTPSECRLRWLGNYWPWTTYTTLWSPILNKPCAISPVIVSEGLNTKSSISLIALNSSIINVSSTDGCGDWATFWPDPGARAQAPRITLITYHIVPVWNGK